MAELTDADPAAAGLPSVRGVFCVEAAGAELGELMAGTDAGAEAGGAVLVSGSCPVAPNSSAAATAAASTAPSA